MPFLYALGALGIICKFSFDLYYRIYMPTHMDLFPHLKFWNHGSNSQRASSTQLETFYAEDNERKASLFVKSVNMVCRATPTQESCKTP